MGLLSPGKPKPIVGNDLNHVDSLSTKLLHGKLHCLFVEDQSRHHGKLAHSVRTSNKRKPRKARNLWPIPLAP